VSQYKSEYAIERISIYTDNALFSADEHAQTSESPNMATATPLGPPRAQTPQKQHAGLLKLDAQPSAASSRPP